MLSILKDMMNSKFIIMVVIFILGFSYMSTIDINISKKNLEQKNSISILN